MYMFESTPELVQRERDDLMSAQMRCIGGTVSEGVFSYDQNLVQAGLIRAGAPVPLSSRRLADFTTEKHLKVVEFVKGLFPPNLPLGQREVQDGRHGIAMFGVTSTGKTTMACAILRRALVRGMTIKFLDAEHFAKFHTTWIELNQNAKAYQDDYDDRADSWRRELWRMTHVYDFFVLDDIGRTRVPEFVIDEIGSLLRSRMANGTFTVVTANKSAADMVPLLGEANVAFLRREFFVAGYGAAARVVDDGSGNAGE